MTRKCSIILLTFSLVAGTSWGDNMGEMAEKARRNSMSYQNMKIADEVRTEASQTRAAKEIVDSVNSEEFQKRIDSQKKRLQQEVFSGSQDLFSDYYGTVGSQIPPKQARLAADERVYVFISASIPLPTLRNFVRDLDRLGDPNVFFVMRGFVNSGSTFAPTSKFISSVLLRDPDCIDTTSCPAYNTAVEIDPNLYRRFRPERVPAVVYVRGVRPADAERSEGDSGNVPPPDTSNWWMVYGDSSLWYSLSQINEKAGSSGLGAIVKLLKQ